MLLFSNLKKYILEGNIYFNHIIHHTNNIEINGSLNYVLDLPSEIEYDKNGKLEKEGWYKNGKFNREGDLPAIIYYYKNRQPWV